MVASHQKWNVRLAASVLCVLVSSFTACGATDERIGAGLATSRTARTARDATTASVTMLVPTTSTVPATTSTPLLGRPSSVSCVGGWVAPTPGSELRTFPLDMIRGYLGLGPGALFVVSTMRYFVGPEDVEITAPRRDVERWYVEASQLDDRDIAGRWIVRRIPSGEGVAYQADPETTGFDEGPWWSRDAEDCDPFTPAFEASNGPYCLCESGVLGCSCSDSTRPICTGTPPENLGCFADL